MEENRKITKTTMREYEEIRSSGVTNMFDYYAVKSWAKSLQFKSLTNLTMDDYKFLLMNFGKLMSKYDIKQRRKG